MKRPRFRLGLQGPYISLEDAVTEHHRITRAIRKTRANADRVLENPPPLRERFPRLLSTKDLADASVEIAAVAAKNCVALAGGVALSLYGSKRLTRDIDILSDRPLRGPGFKNLGSLSFGGQKLLTPSGVPLDVIIRDDKYAELYEAALEASLAVSIRKRPGGWPIPVVPLEYLLTMKLQASRDKDVLDIEAATGFDAYNEKKTHKIIAEFLGDFAVDEFERIAEYAEWKRERGEGEDD